jgi:hypothetical protein
VLRLQLQRRHLRRILPHYRVVAGQVVVLRLDVGQVDELGLVDGLVRVPAGMYSIRVDSCGGAFELAQ